MNFLEFQEDPVRKYSPSINIKKFHNSFFTRQQFHKSALLNLKKDYVNLRFESDFIHRYPPYMMLPLSVLVSATCGLIMCKRFQWGKLKTGCFYLAVQLSAAQFYGQKCYSSTEKTYREMVNIYYSKYSDRYRKYKMTGNIQHVKPQIIVSYSLGPLQPTHQINHQHIETTEHQDQQIQKDNKQID